MQHKTFFASFFIIFFLLVLVGCSNPDSRFVKVEGTVTYQGEKVAGAIVTFQPVDQSGLTGAGGSDVNGKYTLTSPGAVGAGMGVLPGEYTVQILKEDVTYILGPDAKALEAGSITEEEFAKRMAAKGTDTDTTVIRKHVLPAQYRRPDSPLKATVAKGRVSTHDFVLVD